MTKHRKIIFNVEEVETEGYVASALGYGITTQAETLEELRANLKEAVDCYFDDDDPERPRIIVLRIVHEETFAA